MTETKNDIGRPTPPLIPWRIAAIFFLLAIGIIAAGYEYFLWQKSHSFSNIYEDLSLIADLKIQQISRWNDERQNEAEALFKNPFITKSMESWLRGDINKEVFENSIINWMNTLQKARERVGIFVLSSDGIPLISSTEGETKFDKLIELIVERARETKRNVSSDIYKTDNGDNRILTVVPLISHHRQDNTTLGFLVYLIDPNIFLFPFIEAWPTVSPSAETMLVRKDGDKIVFLNEKSHLKEKQFLEQSMTEGNYISAMALRGDTGVIQAYDYRNVPVFAAMRSIPNSNWALVAKIDISEVYGPLRERAIIIATLVLLMITAVAMVVIILWRSRGVTFYRQLYESEHKQQLLAKHLEYLTRYANDIILLTNGSGRIIEANDRAISEYGYTQEQFLNLKISDLYSERHQHEFDKHWKAVMDGQGQMIETVHMRSNGTTFPIEISAHTAEVNGSFFYQAIIRDITERKRAADDINLAYSELELKVAQRTRELVESNYALQEEIYEHKMAEDQIREANAYNRSLIEASLDPLVTIGPDGHITDVNCATETVTGYTRSELIGTDFSLYFTGSDHAREIYQKVFNEGSVRNYDLELRHRNGQTTPVLYNAALYRDQDGNAVGVFAAARDLTELKRYTAELIRIEHELAEAKRLSDVGHLAATVAHELRNPLGVMKAAIYNLKKKNKNTEIDKHINNIEIKIDESSRIIDNLLFYTRLKRPHYERVRLTEIIDDCLISAANRFNNHKISIEKNVEQLSKIESEADAFQIKEVFTNVIDNSYHAMDKERGVLSVNADVELGNTIYIRISDNGEGIDAEDMDHVFEPFFTKRSNGTGLGLAICKQLILLHKGNISMTSERGKGTETIITLPMKATCHDEKNIDCR